MTNEIMRFQSDENEICDKCDEEFENGENLRTHVEADHHVNQLSCEQCEYIGNTQQGLKSHITKKHKSKEVVQVDQIVPGDKTVQIELNKPIVNSEKRTYVLNALSTISKKLECGKRAVSYTHLTLPTICSV